MMHYLGMSLDEIATMRLYYAQRGELDLLKELAKLSAKVYYYESRLADMTKFKDRVEAG